MPLNGADTIVSILAALSTQMGSPAFTLLPCSAFTSTTAPFMGEPICCLLPFTIFSLFTMVRLAFASSISTVCVQPFTRKVTSLWPFLFTSLMPLY